MFGLIGSYFLGCHMKSGYVYILSNEAFPGFLKIGRTKKSPEARAKELSTTGVPSPFKVDYSTFVDDADALEVLVHKALELKGYRYNLKREFFEISLGEAVSLIEGLLFLVRVEESSSLEESFQDQITPNFSQETELTEFIYSSIKLPDYGKEIEQEEAQELESRLASIGYKGCPQAFKLISEIYEKHYISSLKFKEYYLIYLDFLRKSSYYSGTFSTYDRNKREEVGKELAEFLATLSDKGWLTSIDFSTAQSFLIEGDALIYEGYINQVSRRGFLSNKHQEIAINL